jgi:hypothetical protein
MKLALGLLLFLLGSLQAAEIRLPVRPADLLKCLPPSGPDWRLTVSSAAGLKQNPPKSKAVREYVSLHPEEGKPPAKVQLTLVDTCGDPVLLDLFSGPLTIAGQPARRAANPNGSERTEVLLLKRFLLYVTASPEDGAKIDRWISQVDLAALQRAAAASGTADDSQNFAFTVERVDELNPQRNASAVFQMGNQIPEQ